MNKQINCCDGCQRRTPIKDGMHGEGYQITSCTKDRYVEEEKNPLITIPASKITPEMLKPGEIMVVSSPISESWAEKEKELYCEYLRGKKYGFDKSDWEYLLFRLSLTRTETLQSAIEVVENYDFKENHVCRFNDGKQDCDCFVEAMKVLAESLKGLQQK